MFLVFRRFIPTYVDISFVSILSFHPFHTLYHIACVLFYAQRGHCFWKIISANERNWVSSFVIKFSFLFEVLLRWGSFGLHKDCQHIGNPQSVSRNSSMGSFRVFFFSLILNIFLSIILFIRIIHLSISFFLFHIFSRPSGLHGLFIRPPARYIRRCWFISVCSMAGGPPWSV